MFFFEGPKVLFKVALAILNLSFSSPKSQREVAGFFELTRKLRNLPIEVTYEETLVQEVSNRVYTFLWLCGDPPPTTVGVPPPLWESCYIPLICYAPLLHREMCTLVQDSYEKEGRERGIKCSCILVVAIVSWDIF